MTTYDMLTDAERFMLDKTEDGIPTYTTPNPYEYRHAYHRGGGWSGMPHETVYTLDDHSRLILPGHRLGR